MGTLAANKFLKNPAKAAINVQKMQIKGIPKNTAQNLVQKASDKLKGGNNAKAADYGQLPSPKNLGAKAMLAKANSILAVTMYTGGGYENSIIAANHT